MKLYARDIWHLYEVGALMGQRFRCVKELNTGITLFGCRGLIGTVVYTNKCRVPGPMCLKLVVSFKNKFGAEFTVHLKPRELAKYTRIQDYPCGSIAPFLSSVCR